MRSSPTAVRFLLLLLRSSHACTLLSQRGSWLLAASSRPSAALRPSLPQSWDKAAGL